MKKILSFAAMAALAVSAFAAQPVDNNGAQLTFSPGPGDVITEIPAKYTISVSGPQKIKSTLGATVTLTDPNNASVRITPKVVSGTMEMSVDLTPNLISKVDATLEGEWKVKLNAGGIQYVWDEADASKNTKNVEFEYTFKLGAATPPTTSTMEDNGAQLTFDPGAGAVLDAFPTTLTIKVEGPKSITKNSINKPTIKMTDPAGTTQQITSENLVDGSMDIVFKLDNANFKFNRELAGEWKVELLKDKFRYIWEDDTFTKNGALDYTFTLNGNGQPEDPEKDNVKYDIQLTGTQPKLEGFDPEMRDISQGLQLVFNCGKLQATENAMATIKGPGYNHTAPIVFNMGNETVTYMIARFSSNPKYAGEYTLTIPQGVLGTEAWIADPEKGRANEAVSITFNVNGETGPVENTTFNPSGVTPTPNMITEPFDKVNLTFDSKCFFTEGETVKVSYMTDMQSISWSSYTTATITRVSDTEVSLVFDKAASVSAAYHIVIPKGTFWDAAHDADKEAGSFSSELIYDWTISKTAQNVNVTSHIPASGDKVNGFATGEGITIVTDDNARVAKMKLTLSAYLLDSDMAGQTLLNVETTSKNAEGAIQWINEGKAMVFDSEHYYEVNFVLYDENGENIAEGLFEFDGADGFVGIDGVFVDGNLEIHTIDGLRVNGAIDQLPAGLYIIDGKKVVIRK